MALNPAPIQDAISIFQRMAAPTGRVARLSYTDAAYAAKQIEGTTSYDFANEQNIPVATSAAAIDMNETVLDKGFRAQGTSISKDFQNHFMGRLSFNVNLVVDTMVQVMNWLLTIVGSTTSAYQSTGRYKPGDVVYVTEVWRSGNSADVSVGTDKSKSRDKVTWYVRTGADAQGTVGVPPTDTTRWTALVDSTGQPQTFEWQDGTGAFQMLESGLGSVPGTYIYVYPSGLVRNLIDGPTWDITGNREQGNFILRVVCDNSLADKRVATQEIEFLASGRAYARSGYISNAYGEPLFATDVVWYKTKDPDGIMRIDNITGVWAFRIRQSDGHLILAYQNPTAPEVYIDRVVGSSTYGHLLWKVPVTP